MKRQGLLLAAAVIGLWPGSAPARQGASPGSATRPAAAAEAAPKVAPAFDTARFDLLLGRHVKAGRVDYAAWKSEGTAALDTVLAAMAAWPGLEAAPPPVRQAFLVNAYNAFVIRSVLDAYPVGSVKEIPGFFDGRKHALPGGSFTLDEIEKTLLRKAAAGDPGYHFALVCGSAGCPPLRSRAYDPDSLGMQTNEQARLFVADTRKVRLDEAANVLYLSELFRWHQGDFESGDTTLPRWVGSQLSLGAAMKFAQAEPEVRFLDFDWSLNDVPRPGSPK